MLAVAVHEGTSVGRDSDIPDPHVQLPPNGPHRAISQLQKVAPLQQMLFPPIARLLHLPGYRGMEDLRASSPQVHPAASTTFSPSAFWARHWDVGAEESEEESEEPQEKINTALQAMRRAPRISSTVSISLVLART